MDREIFGFSIAVIAQRLAPKPTKEAQDGASLESPRLFTTRAIARWLYFSNSCYCRENLPLRGTFISVFEPFGLETLIQQAF
ncbi:hypothetical protein [Rahnella sikkimica]|uniref:Uncharacterized protein n=1 Tax=Rahnella sikkimica TaxID=1805933 RepID=A0A2L1UPK3_9GAMM|nr:hypothetical protein [Rahnella sikkimica]AVF34758.1 hypothetical protein BV494_07335 [Rahnella sikkimica]